jgi:hypothetical protein
MQNTIVVRELDRADLAALERHFVALDTEDRRLRFGIPLTDTAIRRARRRRRSPATRVFEQRVALFDYALKSQLFSARRIAASLSFSHRSHE